MSNRTGQVNGIQMRWEEQGAGYPVVLIHGIPTSPALWRHVLPKVTGARCLAWEMPGYGGSISEGRGRNISVSHQADYLMSWLKHLGIDRAVFAGHDLGGGVAHIAAVRYPQMCSGLFLTNSIGYDSWPIPGVKMMRAGGFLVAHLPKLIAKQILRTLFIRGHDDQWQAREALSVHWQYYEQQDGAAALIRQVNALDVQDTLAVADALKTLSVPARIVWGAADQFQKIAYGERFARDLKAPLIRIPGGKHFTPEDHPDIVAREINHLLAEIHT